MKTFTVTVEETKVFKKTFQVRVEAKTVAQAKRLVMMDGALAYPVTYEGPEEYWDCSEEIQYATEDK